MRRFSRLAAAQWLFRFCSPFIEQTSLPPPGAWAEIFRAADRGLILPRLAIALNPHRRNVPAEVAQFLETCLELARYRNDRLRDQLLRVCTELNALNIKPILIKGASFLMAEEQPRESRMMLDLDLWVPAADQQQIAIRCLESLGYQMRGNYSCPDFHHYPPFFHDHEIARIELHKTLVHPDYTGRVNQSDAIEACSEHHREGIKYRLLDSHSALALSYIQCRDAENTIGSKGAVMMMKWFDLLDKVKSLGICDVAGPEILGITGDATVEDFQLLTALNLLTELPYSGEKDESFARLWEKHYRQSDTSFMLWQFFGPIFELQRWKGKSPIAIGRALINKVKNIPSIIRRTRSRL